MILLCLFVESRLLLNHLDHRLYGCYYATTVPFGRGSLPEMLATTVPLGRGSLPEMLPAEGPRRARVALFTGCAADAFFPETNVATARVLQKNGCDVWIPRKQVCCGALHYHSALDEPAKAFARQNCQTFLGAPGEVDAIIVNAAGCGAMLKDYGHLFHGAPEQEIAFPTLLARSGTTAIPTERRRHRLNLPRPFARGEALVGAEHAVADH